MVAEASVGVVAAFVDVGAVGEQVEGDVEVGSGVGVVAVVGVDAAVDGVEFGEDAVVFLFEAVKVGGEPVEFVRFGCHEPVEFVVEHPGEGFLLGWVIWMRV
ncbi:hypothetical protein [Kocuria marina]|uniref:hypothetical protein n=1 Tax=Kocuria marina TaxID=223184 RepID=UPI0021B6706C|nr:hypothetical protein [Kocuria indica]